MLRDTNGVISIMDSFQEVHQVLDDFYTDITAANGYIGEQVDSFNGESLI